MSKERNIPSGTSSLGPRLTPSVKPLKVGDGLKAPEAKETPDPGVTAPRRQARPRGGRRPAPAAADAVALTVRVDPEEATDIDLFILTLRDQARRTRLDKAEVIRELLRLAREHEPTHKALVKRLT